MSVKVNTGYAGTSEMHRIATAMTNHMLKDCWSVGKYARIQLNKLKSLTKVLFASARGACKKDRVEKINLCTQLLD